MKREDVSKIIPGITSDQLDSIMNLHGADITAKVNEITTLKAEKTTLTEQLSTANSKLEGYDPEWKAKAEQAKTDAAAQVAALEKGYALERKASGLKFSSESARKAFLTDHQRHCRHVGQAHLVGVRPDRQPRWNGQQCRHHRRRVRRCFCGGISLQRQRNEP